MSYVLDRGQKPISTGNFGWWLYAVNFTAIDIYGVVVI